MDDGATVLERCLDNGWMPWNEVWWNIMGLLAAFALLVFLTTVTIFLIIDWRRSRIRGQVHPPLSNRVP